MEDVQASVFAFLANPDSHGGESARRIDTHAAAVFLAGKRALKIKRAISFPFLDYSTLAKRKAACIAELSVNRRFAPKLYRRVAPITREANGDLAIDGRGDVVEWAVEMERFDENQTLDHIADRGKITPMLAEKLASMARRMHGSAPSADAEQWIAALETYFQQNTDAFRSYPDIFDSVDIARLEHAHREAFDRLKPLLIRRGEQGFVRHGHGDLHLGNIVLIDGEPIAFDAIEFSPIIASGDVLYDFAFLLMDLIERKQVPSAHIALINYIDVYGPLEELDGLALLPFFMSLRSAIRAKVIAARLDQNQNEERFSAIRKSAQRYFDCALALIEVCRPLVVCIGGLSGVGKSTIARELAATIPPSPGALVLRSDILRKRIFGSSDSERLPEEFYGVSASTRVYAELAKRAARTGQANCSVIVDATFSSPDTRRMIESRARSAGLAFVGLFMIADIEVRVARIEERDHDVSDADVNLARRQETYDIDKVTWIKIDASGSRDQTLRHVRDAILQAPPPNDRRKNGRPK